MKKIPKISKLNINLFPKDVVNKSIYEQEKTKYIAEYEVYKPGTGIFNFGGYQKDAAQGEAQWNKYYPNGYNDWKNKQQELTATGHQNIIDKINEIVDHINSNHDTN